MREYLFVYSELPKERKGCPPDRNVLPGTTVFVQSKAQLGVPRYVTVPQGQRNPLVPAGECKTFKNELIT